MATITEEMNLHPAKISATENGEDTTTWKNYGAWPTYLEESLNNIKVLWKKMKILDLDKPLKNGLKTIKFLKKSSMKSLQPWDANDFQGALENNLNTTKSSWLQISN